MARKAAETILGTIKSIMSRFSSGGGQQATNEEGRQGAAVDVSVGVAVIEGEDGPGMR